DDELAGRDGGARALKILDTPVDARYLRIRDARATDGGFTAGQLRAYVSDSLPIRGSSLNGSWTTKTLNPLELMDVSSTTTNALTRPALRSVDLTDSLIRITAGAAGATVESMLGPVDARVFPQRGNKNVRHVYRADANTVNLQANFYA